MKGKVCSHGGQWEHDPVGESGPRWRTRTQSYPMEVGREPGTSHAPQLLAEGCWMREMLGTHSLVLQPASLVEGLQLHRKSSGRVVHMLASVLQGQMASATHIPPPGQPPRPRGHHKPYAWAFMLYLRTTAPS